MGDLDTRAFGGLLDLAPARINAGCARIDPSRSKNSALGAAALPA
jgi:hypothetical protein